MLGKFVVPGTEGYGLNGLKKAEGDGTPYVELGLTTKIESLV